jgi:hypothetical protein
MKYGFTKMIALSLAIALTGCASMCDSGDTKCQQNAQNADETLGDAAAIVVGAAVIGAEISNPQPTTTTETRTCSTDFWGNKTCTTTTQGN